jgi:peptidylprolyl isomerase
MVFVGVQPVPGHGVALNARNLQRTRSGKELPRKHRSRCFLSASSNGRTTLRAALPLALSLTRRQLLERLLFMAGVSAWLRLPGLEGARAAGTTTPQKLDLSKFVRDPSGVLYRDYKEGTGASPKDGDLVVINYIGYLSDGTIFDNTTAKGRKPLAFIFGKKQMVPGVEKGIETMKTGGKRRIIVPSELGFGERGVCIEGQGCLVPPNETLTYDVELMRVSIAPF